MPAFASVQRPSFDRETLGMGAFAHCEGQPVAVELQAQDKRLAITGRIQIDHEGVVAFPTAAVGRRLVASATIAPRVGDVNQFFGLARTSVFWRIVQNRFGAIMRVVIRAR